MKSRIDFFKIILLIIGIIVIIFNVLLYNLCERQKAEMNSMRDKQDVESEFNSNKFKYQQEQIEGLSKDLEDSRQQIKEEKDESKSVQTSLVDIKAEADAIKQDIKGWQKDYVSVLAELEKGVNTIQDQIKGLHQNLNSLNISDLNQKMNSLQLEVEKITHPPDNDLSSPTPDHEDKIDNSQL